MARAPRRVFKSMTNQKLKKVVNQIKKLAKEVYGELGSGFDERVYQRAVEVGKKVSGTFLPKK